MKGDSLRAVVFIYAITHAGLNAYSSVGIIPVS